MEKILVNKLKANTSTKASADSHCYRSQRFNGSSLSAYNFCNVIRRNTHFNNGPLLSINDLYIYSVWFIYQILYQISDKLFHKYCIGLVGSYR